MAKNCTVLFSFIKNEKNTSATNFPFYLSNKIINTEFLVEIKLKWMTFICQFSSNPFYFHLDNIHFSFSAILGHCCPAVAGKRHPVQTSRIQTPQGRH